MRYDTDFADDILSTEWNEAELENDDLKNYKLMIFVYFQSEGIPSRFLQIDIWICLSNMKMSGAQVQNRSRGRIYNSG